MCGDDKSRKWDFLWQIRSRVFICSQSTDCSKTEWIVCTSLDGKVNPQWNGASFGSDNRAVEVQMPNISRWQVSGISRLTMGDFGKTNSWRVCRNRGDICHSPCLIWTIGNSANISNSNSCWHARLYLNVWLDHTLWPHLELYVIFYILDVDVKVSSWHGLIAFKSELVTTSWFQLTEWWQLNVL